VLFSSYVNDIAFIKFCYLLPVSEVAGEDTVLLFFGMLKLVRNCNNFDWVLFIG
jgi:hypothetical protein